MQRIPFSWLHGLQVTGVAVKTNMVLVAQQPGPVPPFRLAGALVLAFFEPGHLIPHTNVRIKLQKRFGSASLSALLATSH